MNEQALEQFCDDWLAAWTGPDAGPVSAFYAPDCLYLDPRHPSGIRGRDGLQRYLGKLLAAFPAMVWRRRWLHPVTGGFVVGWRAEVPVGGVTVQFDGMDRVLVNDGLIVHNEVQFDMTPWLKAMEAHRAAPAQARPE